MMSSPRDLVEKRRRALLLVNQHAGKGTHNVDAVVDLLRAGGLEVESHLFPKKHPIPDMIRTRAADADCVIIGGGDGTLNSAVPALLECGLPLGILPLGTANDLARTLGIDMDPLSAATIISRGYTRELDLGEANGHLFWNVANIGLSATLAQEVPDALKKRLGVLGYAIGALQLLVRMRPFAIEFEWEGRTERGRTFQVSIGNGRYQGGGMMVASTAEPDDGRLHVYSLETKTRLRLLTLLPMLRKGTQAGQEGVRAFTCTELVVRTPAPMPVSTDGALTTETPVRLCVRRRALKTYVPAEREAAEMPA